MEGIARVFEGLAKLLGSVAWPASVFGTVWLLRPGLLTLIRNIGEFSFKGLGIEAAVKRASEITASLISADLEKSNLSFQTTGQPRKVLSTKEAVEAAYRATSAVMIGGVTGRHVLWVNDMPRGDFYERQSLDALGLSISIATTTDGALNMLSFGKFDAVITDMGRPEGREAGYDLLSEMNKRGIAVPVIIYTGNKSPETQQEAIKRGAYGLTDDPKELLYYVIAALQK